MNTDILCSFYKNDLTKDEIVQIQYYYPDEATKTQLFAKAEQRRIARLAAASAKPAAVSVPAVVAQSAAQPAADVSVPAVVAQSAAQPAADVSVPAVVAKPAAAQPVAVVAQPAAVSVPAVAAPIVLAAAPVAPVKPAATQPAVVVVATKPDDAAYDENKHDGDSASTTPVAPAVPADVSALVQKIIAEHVERGKAAAAAAAKSANDGVLTPDALKKAKGRLSPVQMDKKLKLEAETMLQTIARKMQQRRVGVADDIKDTKTDQINGTWVD